VGASTETEVFLAGSTTDSNVKDSIEDLPLSVSRSPQATDFPCQFGLKPDQSQSSPTQESSPLLQDIGSLSLCRAQSATENVQREKDVEQVVPRFGRNTTSSSDTGSPRLVFRRHKSSNLQLTLDGGSSNLESRPPRPLSPFTRAGFPRRFTHREAIRRSTPPPRTASVNPYDEEGATGDSQAESDTNDDDQEGKLVEDLTKAERSGHRFLVFLGRRWGRPSAT